MISRWAYRLIKRCSGFSLMELMMAMALGSVVLTMAIAVFSHSYAVFSRVTNLLNLTQELRLALLLIEHDALNAGIFGSFSFHTLAATSYTYSSASSPQIGRAHV